MYAYESAGGGPVDWLIHFSKLPPDDEADRSWLKVTFGYTSFSRGPPPESSAKSSFTRVPPIVRMSRARQ